MQWGPVRGCEEAVEGGEISLPSVASTMLPLHPDSALQDGDTIICGSDGGATSGTDASYFNRKFVAERCLPAGEPQRNSIERARDSDRHGVSGTAPITERQAVWNAGSWISPSGKIMDQSQRYRALVPLPWCVRGEVDITLSRDTVDDSLVVIHRHRYSSLVVVRQDDGSLEHLHLPFSQGWKRRVRSLLSLRHPNLMPVTDIIMNEARPELLLVHPYVDGLQPLAAVLRPDPRLIHRQITPSMTYIIVRGLVDVLLFLHEHGVVHGAISPWTVMLTAENHVLVSGTCVLDIAQPSQGESSHGGDLSRSSPHAVPEGRISNQEVHPPTEDSDAFELGALMLALTEGTSDALCSMLREKAVRLTHHYVARRISLIELKANLQLLGARCKRQEQEYTQKQRRHSSATVKASPSAPMKLAPAPGSPAVAGILCRATSPVLHRKTGLNEWMTPRTSPTRRGRSTVVTLRLDEQDKHHIFLRWRVVGIAVLFVTSLRFGCARSGYILRNKIVYHSKEAPAKPVPQRPKKRALPARRGPVSTSSADNIHLPLPVHAPHVQSCSPHLAEEELGSGSAKGG